MKALLFHFKKYKVKFVEYSNKSIVNKIENEEIFQTINNGILVFVTIEENDNVKKIYKSLEKDIIDFLNQTWAENIVVCPFAHLSNKIEKWIKSIEWFDYIKKSISKKHKENVYFSHFWSDKELFLDIFWHKGNIRFREYETKTTNNFNKTKKVLINSYDHYDEEKYSSLVEHIWDNSFQKFMKEETNLINSIKGINNKTIIDLWAWYWRIQTLIRYNKYIWIENNKDMFAWLRKKCKSKNTKAIFENMLNINNIPELKKKEEKIVVLLQNTLWTIDWDRKELIKEISKFLKKQKWEFIIGLFRSKYLKWYWEKLYKLVEPMVWKIDYKKTNFNKWLLVTDTNYVSKRRSDQEIAYIKKTIGWNIIKEIRDKKYYIWYFSLK